MSGHVVFVVKDPESIELLTRSLASEGYCALNFRTVEEAVSYLREPGCPANVVAFDISMRRQSDFKSLTDLAAYRSELQFLFSTPAGSTDQETNPMLSSVEGIFRNVFRLEKPLSDPSSQALMRQVLLTAELAASDAALDAESFSTSLDLPYSEAFLRRVALADVPVLLSGETGVGKEVMARRLRAYSSRSEKPFLKLNCAALPPELAESELFGCAKGAFTGATSDRQGRFEIAQGGTILLDEVGDMDLRLQTKLLHVLQDGEIQPLGSNRIIKVNVRVMASTHRDLTRGIQDGTFREDLYYRLNVIKLVIPPLRERREEILPLAETFLARHLPHGQKLPVMNEELKRFLLSYRWPGNVRELENVMRRFLVYQDSSLIVQELLNTEIDLRKESGTVATGSSTGGEPGRGNLSRPGKSAFESAEGLSRVERPESLEQLAEASRNAETELILGALEANRWNRRLAAASLQIEYKAFLYKMQKYGIADSKAKRGEVSA